MPQDPAIEGQAEADVWRYLLQWKACVPTAGSWTIRSRQETTEARPPCVPASGVCPQGERKEATEKVLREFTDRGWLQPCHSDCPPHFVVPKKVAEAWWLVVD